MQIRHFFKRAYIQWLRFECSDFSTFGAVLCLLFGFFVFLLYYFSSLSFYDFPFAFFVLFFFFLAYFLVYGFWCSMLIGLIFWVLLFPPWGL